MPHRRPDARRSARDAAWVAGLAGVAGLAAAWLLIRPDSGGGDPAGVPASSSADAQAARLRPVLRVPAGDLAASRAGLPPAAPRTAAAEEAPRRAAWLGLDLPPPAPPSPGEPLAEPPELPPVGPEIEVARYAAALELLREARARAEQQLVDLERAGDEAGAHRARIRLGRLVVAEERRAEELERARRGERSPHARDTPDTAVESP